MLYSVQKRRNLSDIDTHMLYKLLTCAKTAESIRETTDMRYMSIEWCAKMTE